VDIQVLMQIDLEDQVNTFRAGMAVAVAGISVYVAPGSRHIHVAFVVDFELPTLVNSREGSLVFDTSGGTDPV